MGSKIKFSKNRKILSDIPETPGVYFFWSKDVIIYIGKAVNIRNRISSYLSGNLGTKTFSMVSEATQLSFVKVDSELDALLLEATLIKKFKPRYNIVAKDDKHPLYIRITKEHFPRVITARKIEESEQNLSFYGPFPSSSTVKSVLKMLRRIFPYADHTPGKRPCLYSHIGLCNPCPSQITNLKDEIKKKLLRKIYLENIKMIKMVLERRSPRVEKSLNAQMQDFSEHENFEEAISTRNRLMQLYYITQKPIPALDFLKNPNLLSDIRRDELKSLKELLSKYYKVVKLERIECYDIAHLMGTSPTASMVCFIDGEPEKNNYRRFRINQKLSKSDVHSLAEVAKRRLKHLADWGIPDLVIVDGGKPQVSVFRKYFERHSIPIIGIAKRFESLVIPIQKYQTSTFRQIRIPRGPALNLITRMRDEAHRFARVYHHFLVEKALRP